MNLVNHTFLDNIFLKRPLCSLSVALPVLAALSAWPVFEASTRPPAMLVAVPWTAIIHTGQKQLIVSGSTESYTIHAVSDYKEQSYKGAFCHI